jgi:predicted Zn-dependent peptidase
MHQQTVLRNGIRIVTNRLRSRDSVGLAIWVRVGSRHEHKSVTGISHFVEHMLFKGTKVRTTRKIKEQVEGVGGALNAFTGEEGTCYFVKVPRQHLRSSFDVLQDMINNSIFKKIECEKERTVILEEIKMYQDQPAQQVHEVIGELLWPNQPLGRPIAGTAKSVKGISRSNLIKHVQTFYSTKNILVAACGDLEHAEVSGLTENAFSKTKQGFNSKFAAANQNRTSRSSSIQLIEKKTEQTHFVLGFHGLQRSHVERYRLAVLNVILGGNMSSRLFEGVREQKGLAYEIRSGIGFFSDTGYVMISAGVEPSKAPLTLRLIRKELRKLKRSSVSKGELRRAKDYFLGQMLLGLEDTLDHTLWLGEHVLYSRDVPLVGQIEGEIEKVTEDDISALAQRLFQFKNVKLAMIGPMDNRYKRKIKAELS